VAHGSRFQLNPRRTSRSPAIIAAIARDGQVTGTVIPLYGPISSFRYIKSASVPLDARNSTKVNVTIENTNTARAIANTAGGTPLPAQNRARRRPVTVPIQTSTPWIAPNQKYFQAPPCHTPTATNVTTIATARPAAPDRRSCSCNGVRM
jgi:hypothetical protein